MRPKRKGRRKSELRGRIDALVVLLSKKVEVIDFWYVDKYVFLSFP